MSRKLLISLIALAFVISAVTVLAYRDDSSRVLNGELSSMVVSAPLADHHSHNQMSMQSVAVGSGVQNQQPPAPAETDTRCERPNPNGRNPDKGGTDPKKMGCTCKRTCVNGNIIESVKADEVCKKHCAKDHCDCPNPCKT